jgi:lipid II:glycine glycyltransferase (peptidoglycan interpeptide bridge formation enzyme)
VNALSLRIATEKDVGIWNRVAENDPQGNFFDQIEWCLSLGTISKRIRPLPMLIEDGGKVIGILPLCMLQNPFYRSLESLPFSDYGGGPLFRKEVTLESRELLRQLVKNLIKVGLDNSYLRISIRRSYFEDIINENITNLPLVTNSDTCSFLVSLENGVDQIYKGLEKTRRTSIKEGEKRGVIVQEAKDLSDLKSYYEIYVHTMNRLRSNPLPYDFFKHVWAVFNPKKEMKIFMACYNGRPIGGIMHFIYKKTCHWSGNVSLEQYQIKRPTDLLLWHSIKWSIDNDLSFLDMGSTENDPLSSHYFFKKTWGGEKRTLYTHHIILQPRKYRLLKLGDNSVHKIKHLVMGIIH